MFTKCEQTSTVVVRVTTSSWTSKGCVHQTRSIRFLKRKSEGFNFVEEDASTMGAEYVMDAITNLNTVEDGVYEVVMADIFTDHETGYVEDYTYKLIPYPPKPTMYTGILRAGPLVINENNGTLNITM